MFHNVNESIKKKYGTFSARGMFSTFLMPQTFYALELSDFLKLKQMEEKVLEQGISLTGYRLIFLKSCLYHHSEKNVLTEEEIKNEEMKFLKKAKERNNQSFFKDLRKFMEKSVNSISGAKLSDNSGFELPITSIYEIENKRLYYPAIQYNQTTTHANLFGFLDSNGNVFASRPYEYKNLVDVIKSLDLT